MNFIIQLINQPPPTSLISYPTTLPRGPLLLLHEYTSASHLMLFLLVCSLSKYKSDFLPTSFRCQLKYHFLTLTEVFFFITLRFPKLYVFIYLSENVGPLRLRALVCSLLNSQNLRLCLAHRKHTAKFLSDRVKSLKERMRNTE